MSDWVWVRRTGTTRDDLGNVVDEWTATPLANCLFAPAGSDEQYGSRRIVTTDQLYVFQPVKISGGDQIRGGGVTYDVDGEPANWDVGLVVNLRRVTG